MGGNEGKSENSEDNEDENDLKTKINELQSLNTQLNAEKDTLAAQIKDQEAKYEEVSAALKQV